MKGSLHWSDKSMVEINSINYGITFENQECFLTVKLFLLILYFPIYLGAVFIAVL